MPQPQSSSRPADTSITTSNRYRARATNNDTGVNAKANTNVCTFAIKPLPAPSQYVAIGDWDDLLNAVKARLRLTGGEKLVTKAGPEVLDVERRVRAGVLACLAALDELHMKLASELGRRQQLEREVVDAQTALMQARADLVGSQAGERRARHLALHDCLTALPNRNFFREQLDRALAQTGPQRQALAVLYLDLDKFKPINDEYGHGVGDELLRIIAARLTRAVRADDIVSRMGGDEFACVLGGVTSQEQLGLLACKLLDAVSAPLYIGNLALCVQPSIGIAIYPTDGATTEVLLKNADAAMYSAKRQKTGYAFFDERAGVRASDIE